MGVVIGMDEAGYGPNLGPLVVAATCWEVPDCPRSFDFWQALDGLVAPDDSSDQRLPIADSKKLYSPGRGLAALERSVLATWQAVDAVPADLAGLCQQLGCSDHAAAEVPWLEGQQLELPLQARADEIHEWGQRWCETLEQQQIRLTGIRCDVIHPDRFNSLVARHGNKAAVLSRCSLGLLDELWDPDQPTLVLADKHGGRNRYDELLEALVADRMIFRLEESRPLSRYRIGPSEVRFQMQAERHLPVALASMFAKYLRELFMEGFNAFWCDLIPELRPTRGYPTDARRFRQDIADAFSELQLSESVLWRSR